ncbi:MAG TPA: GMC family oxidoreductase [Thermoleophilaceae bacterium]|nr:GMC family oxidoreductase [Thermoleophilaceae bacterium]
MRELSGDVAIVGSGISGMLVARECLRAGQEVVVMERGGRWSHRQQLSTGRFEARVETATHNHETAPGSPKYPWDYLYAVGGSSLHWTGHAPRLAAEDLQMRTAYGVMVDWPIGYDGLEPFFERAEVALGVAGAPAPRYGPAVEAQPAHPLSPMDRLLAPLLAPYRPLPQARPSVAVDERPACCGAATCALCPVDSRFSVLNGLGDVLSNRALRLVTETVAVRLVGGPGGRATALEGLNARREPVRVTARSFVLAASGFENPAILLRSGLERQATGRYLYDHAHRTLCVRVKRPVGAGEGHTIVTGCSEAFASGAFRSHRAGALVLPFNPGIPLGGVASDAFLDGQRGPALREHVADRWRRTLPFDILLDDVPRPERRVSLSPRRDRLGLPLTRVTYPPAGRYEEEGFVALRAELEQRLAPLGVETVEETPAPAGGHLLGTCRMGSGADAVVDSELRHLDVENVWVVGGSAFPTYSPWHPTLTIAALAVRAGERLAAELE